MAGEINANGSNSVDYYSIVQDSIGKIKNYGLEVSSEKVESIFESANGDGTVFASEFAGDYSNVSEEEYYDLEQDYLDAWNQIAALDGNDAEFSETERDIIVDYLQTSETFNAKAEQLLSNSCNKEKIAQLEEELGYSVSLKDDDRVQYDEDGSGYVNVQSWNWTVTDNNCLERIIRNNYDLESMGIELYDKNYLKLEQAVMDANSNIYSSDITDVNERRNSILLDGAKVYLPGNYNIVDVSENDDEGKATGSGVDEEAQVGVMDYAVQQFKTQQIADNSADIRNRNAQRDAEAENASTLSQDQINQYAAKINRTNSILINNNDIGDILNNDEISKEDMVKIIGAYQENYEKGIINTIEKEYSGSENKDLQKIVADLLLHEAKTGNRQAITILSNEIFHSTEDRLGTNDYFIDQIFDGANDYVLRAIVDKYGYSELQHALQKDLYMFKYATYSQRINEIVL